MKQKQPVLTGFSTLICGSCKRREQDQIAARRRLLAQSSFSSFALQFAKFLPPELLHGLSQTQRLRHFDNVVVFWAWIAQLLEGNSSLSKGLSLIQAWAKAAGMPAPSGDTSSFSKARSRLNLDFILAASAHLISYLRRRVRTEDKWRGLVIKSIDGSSVQLDDTPENQAQFPQPSSQKPGCGFPVMAVMGVLNHAHGAWEKIVSAPLRTHDSALAGEVLDCFGPGDVACADRAFCTYEIIAHLRNRKSHAIMRLHQARHRSLDLRQGKKLGKNQRLVSWSKPRIQPAASRLSAEQWAQLPETLEIRLIWFSYRDRQGRKRRMVLVTTLLDPKEHPAEEVAAVYRSRWDIELRLRDVKTTMRIEAIRAKTPAMAEKTLQLAFLACNLVRAVAQEAAQDQGVAPREVSFKATLDTINTHSPLWLGLANRTRKLRELWNDLIATVAQKLIRPRPGRREPRALKKRPKPFSLLTAPRAQFREIPHRGKPRSLA